MTNKKSRRALGRGLSNLIPVHGSQTSDTADVKSVDIKLIKPNPYQPRLDFDDEDISGLAESIKNQGLIQPIVLRNTSVGYEIISGERRFRAIKSLKKDTVPCIIKDKINDTEMLEMALVENIQRENLNDIEIAISYQKLLFDCGLSHQQLSERVGKSRSLISNTLRLLKLPDDIQNMVRNNKLSTGHARALLTFDNKEEQIAFAQRIIEEKLSVRDTENVGRLIVDKIPEKKKKEKHISHKDADIIALEESLRYRFGTEVSVNYDGKSRGQIEIRCFSKDDLDRIINLLLAN